MGKKTKIKLYVVLYNKKGRRDADLMLKDSVAIYFTDKHCENYDHNFKVKQKGYPSGRWVYPYAIFGELREAKAYIKEIMYDDTFDQMYIKKIEFEVSGF